MCSLFEMENYQGDLTDIVRGSRSTFGCKTEDPFSSEYYWQFSSEMAMNFSSSSSELLQEQAAAREDHQEYSFGDPFCAAAAMRDPLLQELDICGNNSSSSSSANNNNNSAFFNGGGGNLEDKTGSGGSGFGVNNSQLLHEDELIKRPCNLFSRMLQISPATITNKFPISACDSPLLIPNCNNSPSHPLIHANNSDLHHFVDNNPSALQISSPRNPAGIKRRKSQARKVVCVPAPVAASSRPNGEVIPSDLWAWRKYGQKPIKGSPYPRGYYRCSSSKGCSARKQVERSRTDPNMLVITYTSEHNHPWPTQRNALAGSSRSQQSKNNTPNSSKLSSTAQPQKPTTTQEGSDKNKEDQNNNNNGTRSSAAASNNNVKEEAVEEIEKQFETEEGDQFSEGFRYRVAMASHNHQSDDFFADLEELETDPLNLLFTQGQKLDQSKGSGGLDDVVAFNNLFDWAAENNNNTSNHSFEEPPPTASKRGFY